MFGLNYLVDMGVEMCVVSYALGGVVRGGGGENTWLSGRQFKFKHVISFLSVETKTVVLFVCSKDEYQKNKSS